MQRATLRVAVAVDTVTITSAVVFASGEEEQKSETFFTDGKEHPSKDSPGVVLVSKWVGPHVFETVAKLDGETAAVATHEVSPDGKTLTAKVSAPGGFEQTIVFDRK